MMPIISARPGGGSWFRVSGRARRWPTTGPTAQEWLLRKLSVSATDPARYAWEAVVPADPDHLDHARRMLHVIADRLRWQTAMAEARRRAAMPPDGDIPATGKAA